MFFELRYCERHYLGDRNHKETKNNDSSGGVLCSWFIGCGDKVNEQH